MRTRFPLFSHAPAARRSDPSTSHESATQDKAARLCHREMLLEAINRLGPCTAREAFNACDLPSFCCWWKRVSELAKQGRITVTGQKRDPTTGKKCQAYAVAGGA